MKNSFPFSRSFDDIEIPPTHIETQKEDRSLYEPKDPINPDDFYQKGFQEGLLKGYQEAQKELQYEIKLEQQRVLSRIELHLEALFNNKRDPTLLNKQVGDLTWICLQKVMPIFTKHYAAFEISKRIQEVLDEISPLEKITITLSPYVFEDVLKELHPIQKKFKEQIEFSKDPHLQNIDCFLQWSGGGSFWFQDDILKKLESLLKSKMVSFL